MACAELKLFVILPPPAFSNEFLINLQVLQMISIINYGRGNLYSIQNALEFCDIKYQFVTQPSEIEKSKKLLLPGVGAFSDAIGLLRSKHLDIAILQAIQRGASLMGICVGMQILFESGEEFGSCKGLGLLDGKILKLPVPSDKHGDKIPNVGWHNVNPTSNSRFGNELDINHALYFTHSYGSMETSSENVRNVIKINNQNVVATYQTDNVLAVQFHPEKSGLTGLKYFSLFNDI